MKRKIRQNTASPDDKSTRNELLHIVVTASSFGITLLVCMGIGIAAGRCLDSLLSVSPWGTIVCSLIGTASGFWSLYKQAAAYSRREEKCRLSNQAGREGRQ